MVFELAKDGLVLTTDPDRIDFESVFSFLSTTYWARNRPREMFATAIRNSLCFGLYDGARQIGFARAITDRATFAYLADVYVLPEFRGRGLGRWMVESILRHPELKSLRRWCLVTQDQHELYVKCGFVAAKHPEHYMERLQPYPPDRSASPKPITSS